MRFNFPVFRASRGWRVTVPMCSVQYSAGWQVLFLFLGREKTDVVFPRMNCAGYHAVVGLWRLLGWGGSYL